MSCCAHCVDAETLFSERTARRELRRYRRRGPRGSTRLLLDGISTTTDVVGATLLDIGGGVGPIQHELFGRGLRQAVQVDASRAYIAASREEATERGKAEQVAYLYGDFVELAEGVADADIVTLDRVVCCYPFLDRLIEASARKARRVYGLVYPRRTWVARIGLALGNLYLSLRGSAYA